MGTMAATTRTVEDVGRAWDALGSLYEEDRTAPVVAGARAAAEWTMGLTGTSPITNVHEPAEGTRLRTEGHEAAIVVLGIRPGSADFARGVEAWMFWWIGLRPLPRWLRDI